MTTPTPKPCPFCGSDDVGVRGLCPTLGGFWVDCYGCGAEGPAGGTESAAIEAWNRAPRPATTAATQAGADAARARGQAIRQRRALRRARLRRQ